MSWIGLHTSPNTDPHATLCHWKSPVSDQFNLIDFYAQTRRDLGWRGSLPFIVNGLATYGRDTEPKEVAKIVPAFGHQGTVEELLERVSPYSESEWPTTMETLHVTNHRNRVVFEFKWIAVHTRERVSFYRLVP